MKEIITEIEIKAPIEKVWEVLSTFEDYPNWNPFIKNIEGKIKVGEQLKARIQAPEGNAMTFKPVVLAAEKNKEFRWKGKLLVKGVFDGEHYFLLEENNGGTRFTQGEKFSGLLVGLMGKIFLKTEKGFTQMNDALKKKCEG